MSRLGGAFWFVVVIATGMTNFIVKQTVQNLDDQLTKVRRKTVVEQKELHELSADWTFLNQPELLARLNKRYVGLVPVSPKQIVASIDSLPLRPAAEPPSDTAPQIAALTPPEPAAAQPTPVAAPVPAAGSGQVAAAPPPNPATLAPTPVAARAPRATTAPAPPIVKVAATAPLRFSAPPSLDALFAQVAGER